MSLAIFVRRQTLVQNIPSNMKNEQAGTDQNSEQKPRFSFLSSPHTITTMQRDIENRASLETRYNTYLALIIIIINVVMCRLGVADSC